MKSTAPYVRIGTTQWLAPQKAVQRPTNLDWLKPVDHAWHEYTGTFVTGPDMRSLFLNFSIVGRKDKWGRNPGIPLESVIYLDDVVINESGFVSPLAEQREKGFVRMTAADWQQAEGPVPELARARRDRLASAAMRQTFVHTGASISAAAYRAALTFSGVGIS